VNRGAAFALIALALAYQTLALPLYRAGAAGPDFVFLVIVYLACFAPAIEVLAVAFPIAIVLDLVSLDPLGAHVAAYVVPVVLVCRAQGWFVLTSPALRWSVVLAAALLAGALRSAALAALDGPEGPGAGVAALSALYTTALGIPIHALLDRVRHCLGWTRDRRVARWR
jgi:rod shape-determining protein MreD